jgi:uncharacterized membrane protein
MVPEKFRRQLRQEAEKWWTDGLIDVGLYEQLAERYQFQSLEREASHRFVAILMGLGSILLGLAAITFVAANWQVWSRPVKVGLLLSLLIGVNAVGFYLWRRPASVKGQQRLGQGLLLLGGLLLGANLALMSQMFHQSGNSYELFLGWGLGVLAMAYSLRLTSLGVLAWVLIAIGYWTSWLTRSGEQDASLGVLFVQHMPIAASLLFIPLAYWCRSQALFVLGAITVSSAMFWNLMADPDQISLPFGWLTALACTLPPALLWSYTRQIWQPAQRRRDATQGNTALRLAVEPFQPTARHLALWWLGFLFYGLAFRVWWNLSDRTPSIAQSWNSFSVMDVILLALVTGLGWLQLRHDFRRGRWLQDRSLHTGTIAVFLVLAAGLLIWNFDVGRLDGIGVFFANLLLFLLAIGLIRDGLALGSRNWFWGGMVLLVAGIVSRMLEYNTGLLLKSIVFALCGVGIIAAGLWFERNVKPEKLHSNHFT